MIKNINLNFLNQSVALLVIFFSMGCSQFKAENGSSLGPASDPMFAAAKIIIDRNCVSCHQTGGTATRFDFRNVNQFISSGLIEPGNPSGSKLIYRMKNFESGGGSNLNNMPSNSTRVSDSDYQILYNWIASIPSETSPFQCDDTGFNPRRIAAKSAKRLSIRQYRNSLVDLLRIAGLNNSTATNLVTNAINGTNLPQDTGLHFSRTNNSFTADHAQSFFDVTHTVAQTVSQQHLNSFISNFINLNPQGCTTPNSLTSQVCKESLIRNFVSRAFRRPVRTNEINAFITELDGSAANGVNQLLFRVLLAPHFLFQLEDEDLLGANLGSNTYEISPHAYAARLSYTFWNSMPDTGLWNLIATESFEDETSYIRVLDYVLSRPEKIDDAMREYVHDWLRLEKTPRFSNSPRLQALTPNGVTLNDNLRTAMLDEAQEFGSFIFTSGGSFTDLFVDNSSFARHSGLMTIYGQSQPAPAYANTTPNNAVRLPASERAGVLTRAALLVSGSELTNPIMRGIHIRKDILCMTLGAPPSNANDEFNNIEVPHNISTNEKVHIKTSGQDCINCHALINPLGFGLGNFNAFGKFEQSEPYFAVDSNMIAGYVGIDANVDLSPILGGNSATRSPAEFSETIAQHPTAKSCFSEKFLSFATYRPVDIETDSCKLNKVYSQLGDEGSLINMLRVIGADQEFRVRKVD